jgi:predicted amidohydrolase
MHRRIVTSALRRRAELVVFPELSLTGYLLQDLVPELALNLKPSPAMRELLALSRRIPIAVGLVEESEDHRYYNTALFLAQGKLVHRHRKAYLPTYGMFDEGRDFASGDAMAAFDTPWGRLGILICEDAWHPASAFLLSQDGADYILVMSSGPARGMGADPQGPESAAWWRDLGRVTARANTLYWLYVNRVGVEDGICFPGGSFVADPSGEILCQAPLLEETLLCTTLPRSRIRRARASSPVLRDEKAAMVGLELARILRFRHAAPSAAIATPRRPRPASLARRGSE